MAKSRIDHIPPLTEDGTWRIVIETPKGSHNKFKYDPEIGAFKLAAPLPEGMSFPYDFGFFPCTKADDGDPFDVLLLMDAPAFCGCVVEARLLGVIEAEQTEPGKKPERNDRVIAVSTHSRVHAECKSLNDLTERRVKEIEEFFASYNRVRDYEFKVLNVAGPKVAERLVRESFRAKAKRKTLA